MMSNTRLLTFPARALMGIDLSLLICGLWILSMAYCMYFWYSFLLSLKSAFLSFEMKPMMACLMVGLVMALSRWLGFVFALA